MTKQIVNKQKVTGRIYFFIEIKKNLVFTLLELDLMFCIKLPHLNICK